MDREISEMRWFKHPSTQNQAYNEFTWEEKGMLSHVLDACQQDDNYQITPHWLHKILHIQQPKAAKICPKFQNFLTTFCQKVSEKSEESDQKVTKKSEESDQKVTKKSEESDHFLVKTGASNPRGSIKEEREKEREIEREERKIFEPHTIPDDFAIDDGMLEWCRKKYGSVPDWLEADLPEFIGYWKSKGTMRAGWTRTWQKHIDHCMEYEKEPKSPARLSDNWHEPVRGAI